MSFGPGLPVRGDTVGLMPRPWMLLVVGALALTACSGSRDEPGAAPASSPPTSVPVADDEAPTASSDASSDGATAARDASDIVPQWSVTIDVAVDGFDAEAVETSVGWTGDPNDVVDDGPFGAFGSCSGLRDRLGAYSVFVSTGVGETDGVDAVGIWTAERVNDAGTYEAEVRIERSGAAPLTASGTMTILDGLRTGEFLAFGADGGRVEGTFSCSGNDGPAPLRAGSDAAIEVFAVLQRGTAERIVALATEPGDTSVCDPDREPLLQVEGNAAVGSIAAIEIAGGSTPNIGLRIAGTDYEFPDATVTLGDETSGVAGAFSATAEGVTLDGAFTCP